MSYYDRRAKAKLTVKNLASIPVEQAPRILPDDHRHNHQWCEKHWRPYRGPNADGMIPNRNYAGYTIWKHFLTLPRPVELLKEPNWEKAMDEYIATLDKPVCCQVGDMTMEQVLREAVELGEKRSG